jgi:hypothetical protein
MAATTTRRSFLERAMALGLATIVADALPALSPGAAAAAPPDSADATLQAFADTILPGRKVSLTALGAEVHPQAIAGVDDLPGGVEADSLALYHHPQTGFDALEPAFLADLGARSAQHGGDFLSLDFAARTAVCIEGLSFDNPLRQVWEAAAAVPFTAFCAAALIPEQTADKAVGYRVMGLPGAAPNGYRDFSWGRKLARERTKRGSLR